MKHYIIFILILTLFFSSVASGQRLKKGDEAPEIILPDTTGDTISLSSLRGKLVLIDFWASWCVPCRQNNPHLVKIYKEFKDVKFKNADGFTILSVSLDENKEHWIKAIDQDDLIWENHVSDLKGYDTESIVPYYLNGIPALFLVNGDGEIIETYYPDKMHHPDDIVWELEKRME